MDGLNQSRGSDSLALQILKNNQRLYKELLKVTESQYSTGKINQSDVIQVRVELSRQEDKSIQIQQQISVLRAQLGRWIGNNQANRSLELSLPNWQNPPPLKVLQIRLQQHPLLNIDAANVQAAYYEVGFAKEQYKPGWILNVGYSKRQGTFADGMSRPDFVGAQVTVDLPFLTANRQDRQVSASVDRLNATKFDRQTHYRDLLQTLTAQYAIWQHLSEREILYKKRLIPEVRQNAKASLLAYQNASTELTLVLRAYSSELNIKLEQIQIQVERFKSRVALLYLEGVTA
jgi:outer membrane protein TolC